jgi:hypothetical protein
MTEQPEKFDGEMVIIADRELSPETPLLVTAINTHSGEKLAVGPVVLELLANVEDAKALRESGIKDEQDRRLFRHKVDAANACLEALEENGYFSRKVLEVLMEGRIKIGLWIDSLGGEVAQEDKVNWALDYLDRQGAEVHSYVGVKAVSAAFDMAFLADQVNALNKSVFMWHFSDSPIETRAAKARAIRQKLYLSADAKEELADLEAILNKANAQERNSLIREVRRQICLPLNTEGSVFLEGDYLAGKGLVTRCFRHVGSLVEQFKLDFPHHADLIVTEHTTGVEEQVCKKIAHLPDWLDPRPLHLTGKIQKKIERRPDGKKRP